MLYCSFGWGSYDFWHRVLMIKSQGWNIVAHFTALADACTACLTSSRIHVCWTSRPCSVNSLAIQCSGHKYCCPKILLSGKMYRFGASKAWFYFKTVIYINFNSVTKNFQFLWTAMFQAQTLNHDVNIRTCPVTIGLWHNVAVFEDGFSFSEKNARNNADVTLCSGPKFL